MGIFASALDYFQRGGICMWPLLLCSILTVVIGVERWLYYRQDLSTTEFAVDFCRFMNDFNIVGARELAGKSKGQAARLAAETLDIKEDMGAKLETIVYSKVDRSLDALEQNLDYLSVIIGLAPMLGLLGTITGMMGTFNGLSGQLQNTAAVTAGLAEALITTVFGLVISITGMCIHAYLSSKVKTASLNMEEIANVLTDIIGSKNLNQAVVKPQGKTEPGVVERLEQVKNAAHSL
jgi:biopolymer transport protein ExbB